MKSLIRNIARKCGLDIRRMDTKLPYLWDYRPEFLDLYTELEPVLMLSIDRCFHIWQHAQQVTAKPGDIAELGVYKGGTGKMLARIFSDKTVHLFDTFTGMPRTDPDIDLHQEGDFSDNSLEAVEKIFTGLDHVRFHKGVFPETADAVINNRFCFVYIDVDIYQPTLAGLEFFYQRMVSGGVIMLDDYGYFSCPGVIKAVEEFMVDKPEKPIVTTFWQCAIIKY